MSAKDPFSILYKESTSIHQTALEEKSKRVERYRKGKVPDWSEKDEPSLEPESVSALKPIEISTIQLPQSRPQNSSTSIPKPLPPPKPRTLFPTEDFQTAAPTQIRAKPQFVSKNNRSTHIEREVKEQEEQELRRQLKEIQEEKKNRTKVIVAEAILKEELKDYEEEVPESSDEEEGNEEFGLWKIREIRRIIRDKEEREKRNKELKEIERRRAMSDWERKEEDKVLGNDESAKPEKQDYTFMQKYYNKGIYYQERDEHGRLPAIFMRDYNAPVEGDYDKSSLPKILQKRRGEFGKKGQSKYTHLTNEDTTNFDPMYMPQAELLMKQQMKGAGYKSMNQFDTKPKNNQ